MHQLLTLLCTAGILACSAQGIPFKIITYDKIQRAPVSGAQVNLRDINSAREYKATTNESGSVDFQLEKGTRYRLDISKNALGSSISYLNYSNTLSENDIATKKVFDVELEKVKRSDVGNLTAMYFEYDKATLSGDNESSLDNAVKIMKCFPTLQIEIGVYADCREHKEVIAKRVSYVANYLANKGESKRITVKEYGASRALNQCDCSTQSTSCSEEKYLENRRAEFKVIAF